MIVADPSLARGQIEVDAAPSPGHAVGHELDAVAAPRVGTAGAAVQRGGSRGPERADGPGAHARARAAPPRAGGRRIRRASAATGPRRWSTAGRRRPPRAPSSASRRPTAPSRTIEVDGTPLAIGRSGDNQLVLADARVSRHHGRLQARRGALVYTDLGSTNGSRVNGIRVDEIALGMGDRVQLADTVLVVETLPG